MELPPKPTRRSFLHRALRTSAATAAIGGVTACYGFWEVSQIRLRRQTIALPNLPPSFVGKTLAVLTDFHHGPYVGIDFIRGAISLAQSLNADAYALVGDFAHKGNHAAEQLPLCLEVVSMLKAPLGVFAVPGNHDMLNGGQLYRDAIRTTSLTDLTNRAVPITNGADTLWFAGVDDYWWGKPDLKRALAEVPANAAVVLLSHNPDFAETSPDDRVGLMLSGHTHGGQVYLPVLGAPWMPSGYGKKYSGGLVRGPQSQVFVSRGLGEAGVPVRLNCPPEIHLLTLVEA